MSTSPFYLLTSISPRLPPSEVAYQKLCIASWLSAGFAVATVNGRSEVAAISALQLGIEIVVAGEGGKPSIADILNCAVEKECEFAGIVNADCALLPYPDLSGQLAQNLRGKVAISERVDIDDDGIPQPDSCSGFDAFFFDIKVIPRDLEADFRIGVPWWDYCFPLAAAASGADIVNIGTPIVTHKVHHHTWSQDERELVGQKFWEYLRGRLGLQTEELSVLKDDLRNLSGESVLSAAQLELVGSSCFHWLQNREANPPFRLLASDLQPVETMFRLLRISLNQKLVRNHASTTHLQISLQAQVAELEASNVALRQHKDEAVLLLQETQARLSGIEEARSWRITWPIRRAVEMVRRLRFPDGH